MHLLTKQFFSWLLVLILLISPVQVTAAADTDQNSLGVKCQMPLIQMSDMSQSDNCPMQHGEQCQKHPGCAVQFSVSVLPILTLCPSVTRITTQLKFIADNDVFLTRYPALFKRPPKV